MMRRIAVAEDNLNDARLLEDYIKRFSKEENEKCIVSVFRDGIDLISNYSADFDVLFLDIEMPHMSGLDTARKLREIDETVGIIFVTNMVQYAVEGYEVNALDFMLKPVGYFNFASKLKKAFRFSDSRKEKEIVIVKEDGIVRLPVSKIHYIEKDKNYLVYKTEMGVYKERGTMQQLEDKMKGCGFAKCISGCLVNMRHVVKTTQTSVLIAGKELPISRHQRKEFISELMTFFGGGV